jgi:hypothetical protein
MVGTQFYQEVARHVSCVVVSKAFQCVAVDSIAKLPKSSETCDHLI